NELYDPDSEFYSDEYVERLAEFVRGVDALITDCCYTDEAYAKKTGWGHSSVSQVADLACRARPRTLYLIHHDPAHTDDMSDGKRWKVRELCAARGVATTVVAPVEHEEFVA